MSIQQKKLVSLSGSDLREPIFLHSGCLYWSAGSPTKTSKNEDSLFLLSHSPSRHFLAVADGVGGYAHASAASKLCVDTLRASLGRKKNPESWKSSILEAIEKSHHEIMKKSRGSATTLVAVEILQDQFTCFHTGDSSCFLWRQNGDLVFRNVMHSPVGFGLEARLLTPEEALAHEDSHLVANVLGGPPLKIELTTDLSLSLGDRILVCSDGLTDCLSDHEIGKIVMSQSLDLAAHELIYRTSSSITEHPMKADDRSFILFEY